MTTSKVGVMGVPEKSAIKRIKELDEEQRACSSRPRRRLSGKRLKPSPS
jgi:hypothetical protein